MYMRDYFTDFSYWWAFLAVIAVCGMLASTAVLLWPVIGLGLSSSSVNDLWHDCGRRRVQIQYSPVLSPCVFNEKGAKLLRK